MESAIATARDAGDTLGGVVEVVATGVVPGLGSYVHWDRRLDGRLAQAVLATHAIKAFEIGLGFAQSALAGSKVHDPIARAAGHEPGSHYVRTTNNAGGLEGGVTNGAPIILRAAMKPISTLRQSMPSVNMATGEPESAKYERSDVCAVPAAGVVLEAAVCFVLAQAHLEKFGGDAMEEILANLEAYRRYLAER
jgi:chorismate synthase